MTLINGFNSLNQLSSITKTENPESFSCPVEPVEESSFHTEPKLLLRPPTLAESKARKRADNSLELGFRLRAEAEKQGDFKSLVDADLLILSGEFETANHVSFENLFDSQGRRFEAPLQLVSLPTRLDMGYQRKSAYSNRKSIIKQFETSNVRENIESKKLFPYFITPTFPNLRGRNLKENFEFIEEVARQFRDSEYYKKIIVGAFRKTEFTNGASFARKKKNIAFNYREFGYNFHNHYLCVSSVEFGDTAKDCKMRCNGKGCIDGHTRNRDGKQNKKLAKIYTEIVKKVHREMFNSNLEIGSKSKLCVVDIRPVDLSDKGKGIFYEASKYLSKTASFTELEPSELLSANRIFKNKKLISSTGIFNNKKGRVKRDKPIRTNTLDSIQAAGSLDKQPSSIFLNNPTIETFESISSILENQSNNSLKPLSLKEIGVQLCESGNREKWLEILSVEFPKQVEKARGRFLARFPNVIIIDLQGREYKRVLADSLRKVSLLV